MPDAIDLAIIYPDLASQDIKLLELYFKPFGLKTALLPYESASLLKIINSKIKIAIVFNKVNSSFSQDLIIEASVQKIFQITTFYHLSTVKINLEEQLRLMTLGYSGFLTLPFNATETQNVIDINDLIFKAA
jgi:hypothetical protein